MECRPNRKDLSTPKRKKTTGGKKKIGPPGCAVAAERRWTQVGGRSTTDGTGQQATGGRMTGNRGKTKARWLGRNTRREEGRCIGATRTLQWAHAFARASSSVGASRRGRCPLSAVIGHALRPGGPLSNPGRPVETPPAMAQVQGSPPYEGSAQSVIRPALTCSSRSPGLAVCAFSQVRYGTPLAWYPSADIGHFRSCWASADPRRPAPFCVLARPPLTRPASTRSNDRLIVL